MSTPLRDYLLLGRVSNLPTVWSNCLAGAVLAGAGTLPLEGASLPLFAAALSVTFFYVGGMYLNDAYDAGFDAKHRPERPIPAGRISRERVFTLGFLLLLMGEAALFLPMAFDGPAPGPMPLLAGLLLGAVILYYNHSHKGDPLSPLVMACTRALVYVVAAGMVGASFTTGLWLGIAAMLCYLIGLTYTAKQENLAEVKNMWPLAFLAFPFALTWQVPVGMGGGAAMFLLFLVWVLWSLSFLLRKQGRSIPRAVVSLIAGISLLDGLMIAWAGGDPQLLLWALGAFGLTLAFQRFIPGT